MKYILGVVFAVAAFGQHYEIGADIGYGIYRDGSIIASTETAQAGVRNRFAAGITLWMRLRITARASFAIFFTTPTRSSRRPVSKPISRASRIR